MQDVYVVASKSESALNVRVPEKRNISGSAKQAIGSKGGREDVFVLIVKSPVNHRKSVP